MMRTQLLNLIVASLFVTSCADVRAQTPPTPREIIKAMLVTYAKASSYQDTGETIVVEPDPKPIEGAPRVGETLVSYRTYFAGPKMFRFDWSSPRTRFREASVWSRDGNKNYLWTPEPASRDGSFTLTTRKDLHMAIMDAGGSSAGAAYPLISMFIKEANIATSFADILKMATELVLLSEESS